MSAVACTTCTGGEVVFLGLSRDCPHCDGEGAVRVSDDLGSIGRRLAKDFRAAFASITPPVDPKAVP